MLGNLQTVWLVESYLSQVWILVALPQITVMDFLVVYG